MDMKTGDRVKFLNDVGGGVLVAFLDKKRAIVKTSDGFEIPVLISELVSDSGNFLSDEKAGEKPKIPEKKPEIKKKTELPSVKTVSNDEEVCFAIMPKLQSSDLEAYFINNSSYNIHYLIARGGKQESLLFDQGSMDPYTQMKIRKFLPENLNNILQFNIQVLFYKVDHFISRDPLSISVFVNPSEVYSGKALIENEFFDRKALIFSLIDFNKPVSSDYKGINITDLIREKEGKDKNEPVSADRKKSSNDPEEVDLHIEAISDNFSGLSNGEIIEMQMARFKISLETAIIHKTNRIVFIHGVGNGKLKYTLRKALDENYPDLQYQDASFKEYGYGATMVIIR